MPSPARLLLVTMSFPLSSDGSFQQYDMSCHKAQIIPADKSAAAV